MDVNSKKRHLYIRDITPRSKLNEGYFTALILIF